MNINKSELSKKIAQSIFSVTGNKILPLHEPFFDGNELKYVKECIESTMVSSIGEYVNRFEKMIVDFTGSKYAIAVMNGTSALHTALSIVEMEEGDEVLLPALSFVATANAIRYNKFVPHFIDSEFTSFGIDPLKLREYLIKNTKQTSGECINLHTGNRIKALLPVHIFGHPSKINDLLKIANEFNLYLIEDAAESIGSYYKNKHTGTFGLIGTLSFNGNKTITTGGGGAILTNCSKLADKARHITTTAKVDHTWKYVHDEIGYNYRMPNINAALGCGQIENLDKIINSKRKLFHMYKKAFNEFEDISIFCEPEDCKSNYWLNTIILNSKAEIFRDDIINDLRELNILVRPAWELLNTLAPFKQYPSMECTNAEKILRSVINIPSSPSILGINQ